MKEESDVSTVQRPIREAAPLGLNLTRAARYLGVHPQTLKRWVDRGQIESYKTPGRHRRFSREALDEFLRQSGERS